VEPKEIVTLKDISLKSMCIALRSIEIMYVKFTNSNVQVRIEYTNNRFKL